MVPRSRPPRAGACSGRGVPHAPNPAATARQGYDHAHDRLAAQQAACHHEPCLVLRLEPRGRLVGRQLRAATRAHGIVGHLRHGAEERGEGHVERQVDAQAQHHGRRAQQVEREADGQADKERRHRGDARHHGGHDGCLRRDERALQAERVGPVGGQEHCHDGHGHHGARHRLPRPARCPLRPRVRSQHVPRLEVVHDVARQAARHQPPRRPRRTAAPAPRRRGRPRPRAR